MAFAKSTNTVTVIGKIPSSSHDITASGSSLPNTWVAKHVTKEHYQQFNYIEVATILTINCSWPGSQH